MGLGLPDGGHLTHGYYVRIHPTHVKRNYLTLLKLIDG